MNQITLNYKDISSLKSVELFNVPENIQITNISIDTRTITKGSLYAAIEGENFDGHNFVKEAITKGASVVVVSKEGIGKLNLGKTPCICVPNTTKALGELASLWRGKFNGRVIAITGSNGKTTTKEIIYSIFSQRYNTHATTKNYNNHIGVPLTIFSASNENKYLVIEMGTNHPGEIAYLSGIARPHIGVVTNIGSSHLEFFGTQKGILKEKSVLLDYTSKNGGKVFVNADDKFLKSLCKEYDSAVSYGTKKSSDVHGKIKGYDKWGFPKIVLEGFDKHIEVTTPIYGKNNAQNIICASAIALSEGLSKHDIIAGVKVLQNPKQRLEPTEFHKGLLLDDTYNANPESMLSAFDVLRNIKAYKNRWLVLGDMRELGSTSSKLHKSLAVALMKIPDIRVLTIGDEMYELFKELKKYYVPVWHAQDREMMRQNIAESDFSHSVVLVKGSRSMRMEEFVAAILEKQS